MYIHLYAQRTLRQQGELQQHFGGAAVGDDISELSFVFVCLLYRQRAERRRDSRHRSRPQLLKPLLKTLQTAARTHKQNKEIQQT